MRRLEFATRYLLLFGGVPVGLALLQGVPTRSTFQLVVLLFSLLGFGLLLGQFWLTRRLPRDALAFRRSHIVRWHRRLGYLAGAFLLVHPFLMVARRLWIEESDAAENLLVTLRSPSMMPAIVAWALLVSLVGLALARRRIAGPSWLRMHGVLSILFATAATWHVVAIGRHSDALLSTWWVGIAALSIGAQLSIYLPRTPRAPSLGRRRPA